MLLGHIKHSYYFPSNLWHYCQTSSK